MHVLRFDQRLQLNNCPKRKGDRFMRSPFFLSKLQRNGHEGAARQVEKAGRGQEMKKIARTALPATDSAYYVSAADVADKLLDRMDRGMDPRLFSHPVLASVARNFPPRLRRKSD
jgi:hypothetical protein